MAAIDNPNAALFGPTQTFSAELPVSQDTRWTPYGPITPITPFNEYALQSLAPANAAQAAQVQNAAQAAEAARLTPSGMYLGPQVMDPAWLRSDCVCRGGQFVEVPGQPQNSYCLPGVPTGKMFDVATRGCVPVPGFRAPILPFSANCYWKGYNICLYGGIAVGILLLAWALSKNKSGSSAPATEPKKVETELGAGL